MGAASIAVITMGRFIASITPDLIAAGQALFRHTRGNVEEARSVLLIVRDHGDYLMRERVKIDAELAELRAERAREREQS